MRRWTDRDAFCFHLQPCLWAVPPPLSKAAVEQLSARLSEGSAGSTMPRIFLILGCHVLLPVCVQDRLQPLDGSTPRPRLAGEGWVPDQPEGGRGRGHVSQWDSVQDAQCAEKEQGPGLPACLSPFSGLWSPARVCQPPGCFSPTHRLSSPARTAAAAPSSWYKLYFSPLGC